MTEDFTATHKLQTDDGEILVKRIGGKVFDQEGAEHKWKNDILTLLNSPVLIKAPKPVDTLVTSQEGGTDAKPRITVKIHANAAFAALKAASWPEWENAHGEGASCRGDSATAMHGRGANGEKKVRVCQVSPGRVTEFFDVWIPEEIEFEVCQ